MSLRNWVKAFGTDLAVFPSAVKGFRRYWKDYRRLREQNSQTEAHWHLKPSYPCLMDFYDQSGEAHGHYFHQDLLIAQKICSRNPRKHVDVGSRVDGFVAHVAARTCCIRASRSSVSPMLTTPGMSIATRISKKLSIYSRRPPNRSRFSSSKSWNEAGTRDK